MSDPTAIELGPDDAELLVPAKDAERGIPYAVEVEDAPIRYSHSKQAVDRGSQLSPGLKHNLTNLRNQPIWATGHEGTATVRVREAGAREDTQPSRDVAVVEGDVEISSIADVDVTDDEAREIGKARMQDSNGVPIDPATSDDVAADQPRTVTNTVAVQHVNYDSVTSFSQSPDQPMQSSAVPPGVEVIVQADADNVDPVYVGEIALSAGSVFTAQVSNTDKLSVSGSAGDQIRVFHEG